jgi:hypothetical protein
MIGCRQARTALVLSLSLTAASIPAWALSHNRINEVRLTYQEEGAIVEIAGEQAPNFTTFKQDSPRRVIVDVAECDLNGVAPRITGDGGLVEGITTQQFGQAPHAIARVIIQLHREAEYRVTIRGGSLFVHLTPGAGGLLVSAGVPVGPERRYRPSPAARALTPSGSGEPAEVPAGPAVVATHIASPDPVTIADPSPEPEVEEVHSAPPAPVEDEAVRVAMVAPTPLPPPEPEPEPEPAAEPEPEPEPVAVAVHTPAPPAPAEPVEPVEPVESAPAPVQIAQEEPVEVVEEVEEVPEEAVPEVPMPPPEADAAGLAEESEMEEEEIPPPPPPEEEIPPPPPEEVVPPPPPAEEYTPPPEEYTPPPEETVPPPPPSYGDSEERVEISSAVKHMTWVGFQQTRDASRVFIKTNEPVEYRLTEEGENLVVLELENTTIPVRNNRRFLDTHFFDSAVTLVTPREIHGVGRNVRVEIQIKRRVPYRAGREDNIVYINFERPQ